MHTSRNTRTRLKLRALFQVHKNVPYKLILKEIFFAQKVENFFPAGWLKCTTGGTNQPGSFGLNSRALRISLTGLPFQNSAQLSAEVNVRESMRSI